MAGTITLNGPEKKGGTIPYELSPDMDIKVKKAMHEEVSTAASLFKVLADPVRLRILKALEVCDLVRVRACRDYRL